MKTLIALCMAVGILTADCSWQLVVDPSTGDLVEVYICED